jgi:transcriptional regulator with XRE-family HTH domain
MPKEEMGRRIGALLKGKGLTQRQLAIRVGATESAISKYINGEREPRAEVLANIATALDTTVEYLLGKSDGIETEFGTIYDLCARHASQMTMEERAKLISIIASAPIPEQR